MSTRAHPEGSIAAPESAESAGWRRRRGMFALGLAVVPWLIGPGLTQPDTKVDLTLSPWRYLGRALTAWNDHAGLGELQNQAYGYLFPMGPVQGIGHTVGLPPWATQRLWWSLLVVLAWVGTDRLLRRWQVCGPVAAMTAAAAYALAPRVLTVLSQISVEAWPAAVAPWLVLAVLPAVGRDATRRSRWHAAGLTGCWCAALGGVNAVASATVLILPLALILVMGPGRRRVLGPWLTGVLLGVLWWVLPLLVLGWHAYPFLDFIETSRITTAVTSVPNSLRGSSHWIGYILDSSEHPVWQSGWIASQDPVAIVATCAVAGAGMAGLLLLPHRYSRLRWWGVLCVVGGTVLMAVGHPGLAGGPLAHVVQGWLDGPLAPLRNVHKLDPVLRLPLALGLAHLLSRLAPAPTRAARVTLAATGVAVLLAPMALWTGRAGDPAAYAEVPDQWRQVAREIDRRAAREGGATLLLPGSRTAQYTWGRSTDEPLSALATSPVVVRASAPLGNPAATRLLDRLDVLAASGRPQPSLGPALSRMGLQRVVLRTDLAPEAGAEPAAPVQRTLTLSGLRQVGRYGPLSLWELPAGLARTASVQAYPLTSVLRVSGGAEAVPGLLAAGLLDPVQGAVVEPGQRGAQVATDTVPWRSYNNGRPPQDAFGPPLRATDPVPLRPGATDLPPAGIAARQPSLLLVGLRDLHASSTAASPFAADYRGPGAGVQAALDHDPQTAWISDGEAEPSLDLQLQRPTGPTTIRLRLARGSDLAVPSVVSVRLDSGAAQRIPVRGGEVEVPAPRGFGRLRVSLLGIAQKQQAGIAEIDWAGRQASTVVALPHLAPAAGSVLLERDPRERTEPRRAGSDPADLRREIQVASAGQQSASVLLRPRPGPALDRLLDGTWRIDGSRSGADPATRPGAALDGRAETPWRIPARTALPYLQIQLPAPGDLRGLRVGAHPQIAAVRVRTAPSGPVRTLPASGGVLSARTGWVRIEFVPRDPSRGWSAPEIELLGPKPSRPSTLVAPCGSAGQVELGRSVVPLAARAEVAEVLRGGSVPARLCAAVEAPAGRSRLSAVASPAWQSERVVLNPVPAAVGPERGVTLTASDTGRRELRVGPGRPVVLTLTEGAHRGWRASTGDGRVLPRVTIDGWRQGFTLSDPAAQSVQIEFQPTRWHRMGLLVGALAAFLVAALAWVTRRPGGRARPVASPMNPLSPVRGRGLPRAALVPLAGACGWLVAGPAGLVLGAAGVALLPRRHRPWWAAAAMCAAGVALVAFGVVDRLGPGAVSGQLLATLSLALLVSGLGDPGAESPAAPDVPRADRTPTPPQR